MSVYNSTGTFTAGTLRDILVDLVDIQGQDASPMMKRSPLGYIESLLSPFNTSGQEQIPIQDGEKKRQVKVKYLARGVESEVLEVETNVCVPDKYADFCEATVTTDQYAEITIGLKQRQVALIMEGQTEFLTKVIASKFDALARKINKNLLTQQALNFGKNVATGSTAAKSVTVMAAATGAPYALGVQEIDSDYHAENQASGSPIIVGAGNMYKYVRTLGVGCCNDAGVDMLALSNQLGYAFFLDSTVDNVLGANQFIVYEPNTVQFVPFNYYVGDHTHNVSPLSANTTITDPRTGLTYDAKILFDDCKDEWFVKLSLNYTIFFTPADAYNGQDPLYQTNGTYRYTAATA